MRALLPSCSGMFLLPLALSFAGATGPPLPSPSPAPPPPPKIQNLLRSEVYRRVTEDREIMSHASLDDLPHPPFPADLKEYSFYSTLLVHESLRRTREVLTQYPLYARIVPYVDKSDYRPESRTLHLEGGIWKFRMVSDVRFTEMGDRWIHYDVVGGHFKGLAGDIYFETWGEKGTLVFLRGSARGSHWPPTFVIERGAEIVFGFTARRMRSYIEKETRSGGTSSDDNRIPQPRGHL